MKKPKRAWRPGLDDPRYRENRALLKKIGNHICASCGYDIDLQLEWRHPLSWSCDHITPRALLTPTDPRNWHINNLQELHRRCNGSKGAKLRPNITLNQPITPTIDW